MGLIARGKEEEKEGRKERKKGTRTGEEGRGKNRRKKEGKNGIGRDSCRKFILLREIG